MVFFPEAQAEVDILGVFSFYTKKHTSIYTFCIWINTLIKQKNITFLPK